MLAPRLGAGLVWLPEPTRCRECGLCGQRRSPGSGLQRRSPGDEEPETAPQPHTPLIPPVPRRERRAGSPLLKTAGWVATERRQHCCHAAATFTGTKDVLGQPWVTAVTTSLAGKAPGTLGSRPQVD